MSFLNLIKSSLLNLKAHKLRVFLTMIGIIIGISSVITVLSIGNGLESMVTKSAQDANANKYIMTYETESSSMYMAPPFTESDCRDIEGIDGVTKAEETNNMSFMGGSTVNFANLTYSTTSAQTLVMEYEQSKDNTEPVLQLHSGRTFSTEDKNAIILGEDMAKDLFDSYTTPIGKGIKVNDEFFEVVGVAKPEMSFGMSQNYTYIPKGTMPKQATSEGLYNIQISLDPSKDKDTILEEAKTVIKTNHKDLQGEFKIEDPAETVEIFSTILGSITGFVTLVTSISLFVGGIGIMNIMYVSVTERKREIGIRRAIGARPKDILLQFLAEAIFITGLGGIVGIITGFVLASVIGIFLPFSPVLTVTSIVGASAISVIVGIVFGIIPAYNASKLDPIKAIYK